MNKASKKYYKEVYQLFPIHSPREIKFLKELKKQINEYCVENIDNSYEDILDFFGTPADIVKSYYDTIDTQYLLKKIETKTLFCNMLILIFCVFIIGASLSVLVELKIKKELKPTKIIEVDKTISTES